MNKELSKNLERNSEVIARLSSDRDRVERPVKNWQGGNLAYRMMLELVVGMVLGIGVGYGIDSLFNTFPLFLVLFSLLGFGAGVRVMLQTAKQISKVNTLEEKTY